MKAQTAWNQSKLNWLRMSSEGLPLLKEHMHFLLPVEDLVCMVDRCRREKKPEDALHLHTYLCSNGLDTQTSLGNCLVSSMLEIGSMCYTQQVSDRLVYPEEKSWNFLISGYVNCGELQRAFILYQKVEKDESLHLSSHTFVALLKAAAKLKDLEMGCRLHAKILKEGLLQRDVSVCSTLIDMYAKCGSLAKAQEVFDRLLIRNTVCWNVLIAGYTDNGRGEEALCCFKLMQQEGIFMDAVTFVHVLKACSSTVAIDVGQEAHAEIIFHGLDGDCYIFNTLVDMYAKRGLLQDACWVFENLSVEDVISWNTLIAGHAIHGSGEKALHYFEQMQQEGILPQPVTFVLILKACGMTGAIKCGEQIHTGIERTGLLGKNVFVGSAMVDMYAKCGSVSKAQEVFDLLPVKNVVSWNALITGYVENKYGEKALDCIEQMQNKGISPTSVTIVCSLKACGSTGASIKGQEIHDEIISKGLEGQLLISSALVDMYARCGLLSEAHKTFDKFSMRDVVSWTSLMAGYEEHECFEDALCCYEQMQSEGIVSSAITFNCALKACASLGAIGRGQQVHAECARKGLLEKDILVGSTLVDMYVKCGLLVKAQEVFDKLPSRDVVVWTALMAGYMDHGNSEEALSCFEQMQHMSISVDAFALVCSLQACSSLGAAVKGQTTHAQTVKLGLERELLVGSTLVVMYAKCGLLPEAQQVFDKLPVGDVVLWSALITGYAELGESENVLRLFELLIKRKINPDAITFVSALNACSHGGRVEEGQLYFEAMSNEDAFVPNFEHHICMIDLLCRAGQLDKALIVIDKMPFHPNSVAWRAVLAACRKWGNVEFGQHAFEHAVCLDEDDAPAYVCMYNIYGDAAMQEDL